MILTSLVNYYEKLVERGEIAERGWSDVNVSYALWIDGDGQVINITSLKVPNGKKLSPIKLKVPEQVKRSSGISPNFLCDNSSYIIGCDNKGKKERSVQCFLSAAELHKTVLSSAGGDCANALKNFWETWNPELSEKYPLFQPYLEDMYKGANIVFIYNGKYVHEDPEIRRNWADYNQSAESTDSSICMVTGKRDLIAGLHPSIKGIKNAQSSGASLVSYNSPSFCSFNKEQGENAHVGKYAAYAYGAALNHLIEGLSFKNYIGDTAVLCYSDSAEEQYQEAFDDFLFKDDEYYSEDELQKLLEELCQGKMVKYKDNQLDPQMRFYVLGIAPNAARLSVRFFLTNTFGKMIENIQNHEDRLRLNDGSKNEPYISIWRMLKETYREGGEASPVLAGELTRSILEDRYYPATLINSIDLRIRADHKINHVRAAIVKAYYLKNTSIFIPKEVLTVALNKETENVPYNLGRLFAVLEFVQMKANPGINATIKDKYFGSASSIPATTFPFLINLSQKHLRKIEGGLKVYYEKMIGEIMDKLGNSFPRTMNMPERGAFQLGYYHQIQEMYTAKKEKKED